MAFLIHRRVLAFALLKDWEEVDESLRSMYPAEIDAMLDTCAAICRRGNRVMNELERIQKGMGIHATASLAELEILLEQRKQRNQDNAIS